jgi:predicted HD phosphohydrolase
MFFVTAVDLSIVRQHLHARLVLCVLVISYFSIISTSSGSSLSVLFFPVLH